MVPQSQVGAFIIHKYPGLWPPVADYHSRGTVAVNGRAVCVSVNAIARSEGALCDIGNDGFLLASAGLALRSCLRGKGDSLVCALGFESGLPLGVAAGPAPGLIGLVIQAQLVTVSDQRGACANGEVDLITNGQVSTACPVIRDQKIPVAR